MKPLPKRKFDDSQVSANPENTSIEKKMIPFQSGEGNGLIAKAKTDSLPAKLSQNKPPIVVVEQEKATHDFINWILAEEKSTDIFSSSAIPGLQGAAGTGKTYVVALVVLGIIQAKPSIHIVVAAPTHKALGVLRSKIETLAGGKLDQVKWVTVASLLGDRLIRLPDGSQKSIKGSGKDNLRHAEAVFIDEVSMVERETAERVRAAYPQAKIMLIGDPGQLRPVRQSKVVGLQLSLFGKSSADTGKSDAFDICSMIYKLDRLRRTASTGPLLRLYQGARDPVVARDKRSLELLCQMKPGEDRDAVFVNVDRDGFYQTVADYRRKGNSPVILAWRNKTVAAHNKALHDALYPDEPGFSPREPVVCGESWPESAQTPLIFNSEMLDVIKAEPVFTPPEIGIPCQRLFVEPVERKNSVTIEVEAPLDLNKFLFIVKSRAEKNNTDIENLAYDLGVKTEDGIEVFKELFTVESSPSKSAIIYNVATAIGWSVSDTALKKINNISSSMPPDIAAARADVFKGQDAESWLGPVKAKQITSIWGRCYSLYKIRCRFAPLQYAYSITNHRAQASTMQVVFVDMLDLFAIPNPEERSEAVYTSITRAAKRLALCWIR